MQPEPVLIIDDWWDCPRSGVALFRGEFHHFDRIFDESADEWSDRYRLTPLDSATFALFERRATLFQRWSNAFDSGKTDISTHPALPDDLPECRALDSKIEAALKPLQSDAFEVIGKHSNIRPQAGRIEYPETNSQFLWSGIARDSVR
jgi:hypothetical protein